MPQSNSASPKAPTPDEPNLDLAAIHPHDALLHSIGTYSQVFSGAELMLSVVASKLLRTPLHTVQFLWRDVGFRAKTKTIRRAAKEAFGRDAGHFKLLNGVLNRLDSRSEFRNDLAHSTFLWNNLGARLGRAGNSFKELFAEMKPIDYKAVLDQSSHLTELTLELASLLVSNFSDTKLIKSSQSSLEKK